MSLKVGYQLKDAYRLKAYFADGSSQYDDYKDAVGLELEPQIVGLKTIVVDLNGKKPIYYIRRFFDFNTSDSSDPIEVGQEYFIGHEGIPKKLLSVRVSSEIREIEDDNLR